MKRLLVICVLILVVNFVLCEEAGDVGVNLDLIKSVQVVKKDHIPSSCVFRQKDACKCGCGWCEMIPDNHEDGLCVDDIIGECGANKIKCHKPTNTDLVCAHYQYECPADFPMKSPNRDEL